MALQDDINAANIDPDLKPLLISVADALDVITGQVTDLINNQPATGSVVDMTLVQKMNDAYARVASGASTAATDPAALGAYYDGIGV